MKDAVPFPTFSPTPHLSRRLSGGEGGVTFHGGPQLTSWPTNFGVRFCSGRSPGVLIEGDFSRGLARQTEEDKREGGKEAPFLLQPRTFQPLWTVDWKGKGAPPPCRAEGHGNLLR